jgi:chromosomal replication initiator protein
MESVWLEALSRLRHEVGDRNFATWIEPIRYARDERGLRLEVPNRFFQEWVTRHFLDGIRSTLSGLGVRGEVRITVVPSTTAAPAPLASAASNPRRDRPVASRGPKIGRLVAEYTFDGFVVGDANEVAYRAARAVAEAPGRRYNPLFLWGGVGLGKTHLINAVAHELLARNGRCRVACLAAETFMNQMIGALRQDQMAGFRDRFRDVDVLILDDVEFLAGKERTQEEFFHTFNALHAAGKQVVLTSDKPPHAIAELEQRLRSRFEGGLIADVRPPNHVMRVEIVTRKAALHGVELSPAVAATIAHRSGSSVRELEGALTRVLAEANLRNLPLEAALVERVLTAPVRPVAMLSVELIQDVVGRHFRVGPEDLKSPRRERGVVVPRQIAMYLCRTLAELPFPAIGEKFGGRDHSTVIHAVRAVESKRGQDPQTDALLQQLEHELRARHP